MPISTSFTSRLSGALLTRSITKLNAFMHITGKTLGESLISSITNAISFAKIGSQEHSSLSITRDASNKHRAPIVTDGKSRSTILCTTRLCLAKKKSPMAKLKAKLRSAQGASSVPTTTLKKTSEIQRCLSNNETALTLFTTRSLKCL